MENHFDSEYYVMNVDGANNHPLLDWGSTDFSPFLTDKPIGEADMTVPLQLVFGEPSPQQYEMADLLMLSTGFAGSGNLKELFGKMNIYGAQFLPAEITSNTGEVLTGHFAIHFWNKLPAIDKNNYVGGAPNRFGNILDLQRFSLDKNLLENIPLEKRTVFELSENTTIVLVHRSIYEAIRAENLTGFSFSKVSDWDGSAMFR